MSENDSPKTAACYFCHQEVDAAECLCSGCGEIICEDCNGPDDPWGEHEPTDHRGTD